jgi:hypothetical protein
MAHVLSTDWIQRLNQLRRSDPDAVREIEQRGDEIFEGYSEEEAYRQETGPDRQTSRARAVEEALEEYERMVAATGPVEGGMLDTYEPPGVEGFLQMDRRVGRLGREPGIELPGIELEEEEEEERLLESQLLQLGRTTPGLDATFLAGVEGAGRPVSARQDATAMARLDGLGAATSPDVRPSPLDVTTPAFTQRDTRGGPNMLTPVGGVQQRRGRDDYSGQVAQRQLSVDPRQRGVTRAVAQDGVQQRPGEDGGGLLQMLAGLGGGIGGWAKENPELLMAGLQTIGELGGQYKRGRREQEASDAEAQERRMSGAISALTRGRVTPEVGRRVPRTTAGEGMFDVMAGIGRGGTQFLEGQRGREEREEALEMYREERGYERTQAEQAREDAFEERLAASDKSDKEKEEERARWEREQGREDREQSREDRKLDMEEEENALKRVPQLGTTDLTAVDAKIVQDGVNELIRLFESGGPTETGTYSYEQTYGMGAERQAEFDRVKAGLIGTIKEFFRLGRLSDRDLQIVLEALPNRDRSSGYNRGVRRGLFTSLQIASQGRWQNPYDPENKKIRSSAASGKGQVPSQAVPTEQPVVAEVEELPEEVEDLVERAENGDIEAIAELRTLGYID